MSGSYYKLLSAFMAAALASCAVGPDFIRPAPPPMNRLTAEPLPAETASVNGDGGNAQRFENGADISAEWWSLFRSPPLNALIAQALRSNPDLKSARAALRVAKENVMAQEAAYFPTVTAGLNASRNHNSSVLSPTLFSFAPYFNLYSAQLSAEWTPDVWGGNRRAVEALKAAREAQGFQLQAAYLTLTSALAAAAVQEASIRAQIAATKVIVRDETDALTIVSRQLSVGQISGADVAAQQTALAQARQALPPLEKQLAQERDLIAVLAGRFPSDPVLATFDLDSLVLPHELPVSIPSGIVDHRPDIRIAEANLHAASAEIGVSIANELPQISLTAADGTTATRLAGLFGAGSAYWSVGAGLSQTVFDAGALLHKTRAAQAAYDEALAQYQGTVLTAFQNVADTLEAVRSDADTLKAASEAAEAAKKSLDAQSLRLKFGDASALPLLNAEQAYSQSVIALAQARASRFADSVALFEALGGGWWNRNRNVNSQTAGK